MELLGIIGGILGTLVTGLQAYWKRQSSPVTQLAKVEREIDELRKEARKLHETRCKYHVASAAYRGLSDEIIERFGRIKQLKERRTVLRGLASR